MHEALKAATGKPVSIQILNWLETDLTPADVESVATFATFPLVALMTATQALQENLSALARHHTSSKLPRPRIDMNDFKGVIGYDDIVALQDACVRT